VYKSLETQQPALLILGEYYLPKNDFSGINNQKKKKKEKRKKKEDYGMSIHA
jgi:hypothetical protein